MWLELAIGLYLLNVLIAIFLVFRRTRDIAAIWAWLLVLLLLPGVGFGLYWAFGRKLSRRQLSQIAAQQHIGMDEAIETQKSAVEQGFSPLSDENDAGALELVRTLLNTDEAFVTADNEIDLFRERTDFAEALFTDIKAATDHIHIEAYTIEPDEIGEALLNLLTEKASEGLDVRVVYDPFGSHRLKQSFWRPLRDAGGDVVPFVATRLGGRLNLRINFRNHRKLAVIDGRSAYLGGFDLGYSFRRYPIHTDTQLHVVGGAVSAIQARFIMDWQTAKRQTLPHIGDYFPETRGPGQTAMQVVAGGPEQPVEAIKLGFLRLMTLAKERIWIQSPYFVPDDSLSDALLLAAHAGIDVRVMVPLQTNQQTMARATRFYLDRLVLGGVTVYGYTEGFLHSKMILVDSDYLTIGSANLDIRSFRLNFEVAAFMYDRRLNAQAAKWFEEDMQHARLITAEEIQGKKRLTGLNEELARLLAPIL